MQPQAGQDLSLTWQLDATCMLGLCCRTTAAIAAMTQLEWPGARVRAAFNEFFQSKAHTYWASNAVVGSQLS
jgi:hypothetical protein